MRALRSARNASAAQKANHTIIELYLGWNAIGNDGAIAIADGIKALLLMLCFPLEHDRYSGDKGEHCLATDMLAHEKGSAPSSQSRTCCVARNVSHRMAKRWNIRSDGVLRRVPWHRVRDADHK